MKTLKDGGEDPPKDKKVFKSIAEINAANEYARALLRRQNVKPSLIAETVVARNIGDKVPTWEVYGNPPSAPIARATFLPTGVTLNDVINTKDGYGYYHPQNGNWIPVDISAITQKYGQNKPFAALKNAVSSRNL